MGSFLSIFLGRSAEYGSFGYFFYGIPAMLAGLLILRFAEGFVNFTYRRPELLPPPLVQTDATVRPSSPE